MVEQKHLLQRSKPNLVALSGCWHDMLCLFIHCKMSLYFSCVVWICAAFRAHIASLKGWASLFRAPPRCSSLSTLKPCRLLPLLSLSHSSVKSLRGVPKLFFLRNAQNQGIRCIQMTSCCISFLSVYPSLAAKQQNTNIWQ